MLLKEIKKVFHTELDSRYPKEEVDSFFYLLLEHYLHLERFIFVLQPDYVVSREEEEPLFSALHQLRLHRPIQYILGETQFMDLKLRVNEQVLIPRPETEELARWILSEYHQGQNPVENGDPGSPLSCQFRILDIGTGSGCLAIALGKNLPAAEIQALDISEKALEVARINANENGVDIHFIEADILGLEHLETKFDLIVSNPPYVRHSEKGRMQKNVVEYEPGQALYVPDEDALVFYKAIVGFAARHLKENGYLYVEVNQYLAMETHQLLEDQNFTDIELRKDMFGNFRMLKGKTPPRLGR